MEMISVPVGVLMFGCWLLGIVIGGIIGFVIVSRR